MGKIGFEEWLRTCSFAEATINNYIRAINFLKKEFNNLYIQELFENQNLDVIDKILSTSEFNEINDRHHRVYSAALNQYRKYLEEVNKKEKVSNEKTDKIKNEIVEALKELGGTGTLENIYKKIQERNKFNLNDYKDWKAQIRKQIYLHSSSTEVFNGIPGDENDIFYAVEGKYKGVWGLRNYKEKNEFQSVSLKELIEFIHLYIKAKGFNYSLANIINFYLSIRTKPFVIISGISGTGKTKIVQLFAEAIGATENNRQFKLIPVRPDWSDSSDLLGYRDIKGEFVKGPFTEIVEHAIENPELPHFVLLDEMNLARVEYYFSDVLSVMESRKKDEFGNYTSSPLIKYVDENKKEKTLMFPGNLYVIGTVNMDETTHTFSKKVLDRANTIEFNDIHLMDFDFLENNEQQIDPITISNDIIKSNYIFLKEAFKDHKELIKEVSKKIEKINKHLEPIYAQVGYRVRDEICFYMIHNSEANMLSKEEAMDFCIMQKILPRISGTENLVGSVIDNLKRELASFEKCSKKLKEMQERLNQNGFVSFWSA